MPGITVSIDLDASVDAVWADVEDIGSHVEWMEDAVAIKFTSENHSGVDTTFDCETKVGPIRLTDHMEITDWEPPRRMGVRHVGIVTGSGHFTLEPLGSGPERTRFVWTEELYFPWYLAGPLGAMVARPVLRRIWRTNLANLKRRIES